MGSHVHKRAVAVAGDASRLDAKNNTFFHEIQEYEGIEFRTQRRYTRKKENSKLSSLLTLSSRASTRMIAEKLDSHLTLINSGILVKEFGGESGVNINVSGFPYYRLFFLEATRIFFSLDHSLPDSRNMSNKRSIDFMQYFYRNITSFFFFVEVTCNNMCPGKSFGLKFIPRQSDSFRFIPKSVSAPIRTHSNQSEKVFNLV